MKAKYFAVLTVLAAALTLSCEKGPKGQKEDPSIQVSPEAIEAGWEGTVQEIDVTSNCSWTLSKTDAEGTAVDWVKCDRTTGKGNLKFNVKVEKNPLGEARSATVTLFCNDVKAFIDVQQEANPDPNPGPGPGPQLLELEFDFTQMLEGWPTSNDDSWAGLKNCDSGCATDNGGTATDNSHRRAQVTYTLNGKGYDFTFADPNGAEKHNIRLDGENRKGVYSGTLRYFGLPAIEGKKLVKVEMVQNASTKTSETFFRNVGVTAWVYHKDVAIADIQYVSGGEVQNQNTNGETYTYELSGTYPNRVYWLNSPTNASIIKTLKLYYDDPDGTEVAPGPEPADPTPTPPGPDPGDDPVHVEPTMVLTFSFTGTPFEGWPTAAKYTHVDGGIECVYPLDGVNYVFVPADCNTASAGQAFWQPPVEASEGVEAKPGYFAFNAQYRYLGLPKLEGYILSQVICHNVYLTTVVPKMGITTLISSSAAHPSNDAYVPGGEIQTWDANGGQEYTYNLAGTAANTRYYIYAYAKGAVDWIKLGYYPATQ